MLGDLSLKQTYEIRAQLKGAHITTQDKVLFYQEGKPVSGTHAIHANLLLHTILPPAGHQRGSWS